MLVDCDFYERVEGDERVGKARHQNITRYSTRIGITERLITSVIACLTISCSRIIFLLTALLSCFGREDKSRTSARKPTDTLDLRNHADLEIAGWRIQILGVPWSMLVMGMIEGWIHFPTTKNELPLDYFLCLFQSRKNNFLFMRFMERDNTFKIITKLVNNNNILGYSYHSNYFRSSKLLSIIPVIYGFLSINIKFNIKFAVVAKSLLLLHFCNDSNKI